MFDPAYTIVLTHDVDSISLKGFPLFGQVALSFIKECLAGNLIRLLRGDLSPRIYIQSFFWGLGFPLIKVGLLSDPWEKSIERILRLEKKYGVKSTFFFIPFKNRPGSLAAGKPAPERRAAAYDVRAYGGLLRALEDQGWEVGVHGIEAHLNPERARQELEIFQSLLKSKTRWGMRMHWLYRSSRLEGHLKQAGFFYDATYGSNEEIGYPEGRFRPFLKDGLWVLPLNIQDVTVLAKWRKNLRPKNAWKEIERVLELAKIHRAVVTVLWHNNSFGPPRYWENLYEKILEKGRADGAAFKKAIEACVGE
jgi:peptidoglycan/xylan/chitin deacetylase (PgdA/CDA1 family)